MRRENRLPRHQGEPEKARESANGRNPTSAPPGRSGGGERERESPERKAREKASERGEEGHGPACRHPKVEGPGAPPGRSRRRRRWQAGPGARRRSWRRRLVLASLSFRTASSLARGSPTRSPGAPRARRRGFPAGRSKPAPRLVRGGVGRAGVQARASTSRRTLPTHTRLHVRARSFRRAPGKGSRLPPLPPLPPHPSFRASIDEAIRVASERAPGGPALPRSFSRGSRGVVRCSGTGGLLSGSLPAVGEARRSPARAGSGGRPPLRAQGKARPTESSRVTAERPREPQAYRVRSSSEAPAPASSRGPSGAGREQRAGGVATEEKPWGKQASRADGKGASARAGEPGGSTARRVPLRSGRGVGAGGVRRPPPRFRAAASSLRRFSCRVPARCGARRPGRERERAPERGVAPASRSRSPLARPPSAAGGPVRPRPLVRRSRRAGQPRPRAGRASGSRGGSPERAAESSCAAAPAPSPRGGGRRGRPGDRARLSPPPGEPPAPPSGDRSPRWPPPSTRERRA